jgi:hypothetical protein
VARIAAHDAHHPAAANYLAFVANTPDAGADFHGNTHPTRTSVDKGRSSLLATRQKDILPAAVEND